MTRDEFIKLLEYNEWKFKSQETQQYKNRIIICDLYLKNNLAIEIFDDCIGFFNDASEDFILECKLENVLWHINNTPELVEFKLEPLPEFNFWKKPIIKKLKKMDCIDKYDDDGTQFYFRQHHDYIVDEHNAKILHEMYPLFKKLNAFKKEN